MAMNDVDKFLDKYRKQPRTEQLINTQKQIVKNLDALKNALIANDLAFMQLSALSKNDSRKGPVNTEKNQQFAKKSFDNVSDINTSRLDLASQLGNLTTQKTNCEEEEEEEDEEEELN